jgi:hypothetical protein
MNIDSIVNIAVGDTSDVVDSTYNDFTSISIPDSGYYVSFSGDTLLVPPGILISERKAALYVYFRSSWERQATELYFLKMLVNTYCERSHQVELLYQREIDGLRKQVRRNWFEKNAGYVGFGAALLVMVVRDFAVSEMMQ